MRGIGKKTIYSFAVNCSEINYFTYEVQFDEMEQSIWYRNFHRGRRQVHDSKTIIKLGDSGYYEMLILVPLDSVVLDDWVVVDEELMAMLEGM